MASSSESFQWQNDFDEIFEEVVWDSETKKDQCSSSSIISVAMIVECVRIQLKEITPNFSFYKEATDFATEGLQFSDFCNKLWVHLQSCIEVHGKLKGGKREKSQSNFYNMASKGFPDLLSILDNQKLVMWLAINVFDNILDTVFKPQEEQQPISYEVTQEEMDIVHYIGGSIIAKLKKKTKNEEIITILNCFIVDSDGEPGTLVNAKTRGRLTVLSNKAKSFFVEMEQVFRDHASKKIDHANFTNACLQNQVIQDCFHSSTFTYDDQEVKEHVITDIVSMFFKIRVHHQCKVIMDMVRVNNKISTKDRSLRAKLAK